MYTPPLPRKATAECQSALRLTHSEITTTKPCEGSARLHYPWPRYVAFFRVAIANPVILETLTLCQTLVDKFSCEKQIREAPHEPLQV